MRKCLVSKRRACEYVAPRKGEGGFEDDERTVSNANIKVSKSTLALLRSLRESEETDEQLILKLIKFAEREEVVLPG